MTSSLALAAGCAVLVTALGVHGLARLLAQRDRGALVDTPNSRSLHVRPTLRLGGLGMAMGVVFAMWIADFAPVKGAPLAFAWLGAGVLLVLGGLDDLAGLSVAVRLAVQLAVCIAFTTLVMGAGDELGIALVLALGIGLVWWTNAYNFMDGADGLAGGMALIGFGAFAVAARDDGGAGLGLALTCMALAGAALGFLSANWPPARVFLGDAGSLPLGFLGGALSLVAMQELDWPGWFGPMVFAPFLVDATLTLVRRAWKGQRVWEAHREHFYQRLILSGWSHRKACIAYYFLMLASAICALSAKNSHQPWTILTPMVLTYAALAALLERRFRQEEESRKKSENG